MRGPLPVLILLAGLAGILVPAIAAGGDEELDEETQRLLRVVRYEELAGSWLGAVNELKQGTPAQRKALAGALEALLGRRLAKLKQQTARLTALASRVGDGGKGRKALAAWDRARKRAVRWIFDPVSFPDPQGGKVYGPMAGSEGARRRCSEAVEAYNALRKHLDRAVGSALNMKASAARALFLDYVLARIDALAVIAEMLGLAPVPKNLPEPDPLALLFLDARLGQFPALALTYEAMPEGWRKLCVFHAYCRGLLLFNEAHPCGMGEKAVEAVGRINEVRIALGLSPASHSGKLARMARAHTAEQIELGYWGHRSPTPANHTTSERAANVRYKGEVTECLALTGSPLKAIDIWYYDGAHFRGLMSPQWIECGLSDRKPVTWNAGDGDRGLRPGIRYGDTAEAMKR